MSLISRFALIVEESKKEYEQISSGDFFAIEKINQKKPEHIDGNMLAFGDNAKFMKALLDVENMRGKIQCVYIDPPFFSKSTYDAVIKVVGENGKEQSVKHLAYEDVWEQGMEEYLRMFCLRLYLIRDLLKDDGVVWVHLDWHIVHYVKILMDEIFGDKNFVNEIVWQYKSGGTSKRHFSRKHDTLLVYGKSKKYYFAPMKEKSYNRGLKPYRFKGVKEYKDELGWYTMVIMKDVWNIDMVGRTSRERTGYATQKPSSLLERIIESSTREGDICADFFCGSGTLAAAADKMGRRWICCDSGKMAIASTLKRLKDSDSRVDVFHTIENPWMSEISDIKLKVSAQRENFADKKLIRIKLDEYLPEDIDNVDDKGRELIQTAQEKDPVALIDYWSVDFDYDGKVHRPWVFLCKNGGKLEKCCEQFLPANKTTKINIQIIDILGNCKNLMIDGGQIGESVE